MSYLDSKYTRSERARAVQASWHDVLSELNSVARRFETLGDTREAMQLAAYRQTFESHALRHLERVLSENGHTKDSTSTVGTELPPWVAASEDPIVCGSQQAPLDEKGASDRGGGECLPPDAPTAAEPTSSIEDHIQLMIAQLDELMPKHPNHQPYEVALKMLHRSRSLARESKTDLARRQLRAAINCIEGGKEIDL